MAYQSLFDVLKTTTTAQENGYPRLFRPVEYKGDLSEIVDKVSDNLTVWQQNQSDPDVAFRLTVWTPRILRAVIDYKINHPESNMDDLVQPATDINLAVYATEANVLDMLSVFAERLATEYAALLHTSVEHKEDSFSWNATDPEYALQSAANLTTTFNNENILLIAMAHGAVNSGMDIFHRYVDLTQSDSAFYPVRFSRNKIWEQTPQLTESEVYHLKELTTDRQVVVFDGDTVSGRTLDLEHHYFEEILQTNVSCLVTMALEGAAWFPDGTPYKSGVPFTYDHTQLFPRFPNLLLPEAIT